MNSQNKIKSYCCSGLFPFAGLFINVSSTWEMFSLLKQNGNQKCQQPIAHKGLKIPTMAFYGRRHFLFRVESGPTLAFVFSVRICFSLRQKNSRILALISNSLILYDYSYSSLKRCNQSIIAFREISPIPGTVGVR